MSNVSIDEEVITYIHILLVVGGYSLYTHIGCCSFAMRCMMGQPYCMVYLGYIHESRGFFLGVSLLPRSKQMLILSVEHLPNIWFLHSKWSATNKIINSTLHHVSKSEVSAFS